MTEDIEERWRRVLSNLEGFPDDMSISLDVRFVKDLLEILKDLAVRVVDLERATLHTAAALTNDPPTRLEDIKARAARLDREMSDEQKLAIMAAWIGKG